MAIDLSRPTSCEQSSTDSVYCCEENSEVNEDILNRCHVETRPKVEIRVIKRKVNMELICWRMEQLCKVCT